MVKPIIDGDTLARVAAYAIEKEENDRKRDKLIKIITQATFDGWINYLRGFFTISKGYEVYLTPRDRSNFRYRIDANYHLERKQSNPPSRLWHCRDYIQTCYQAVHADKMEADDMLSIRAFEEKPGKVILVGNDKDFNNVDNGQFLWRLDHGIRPYAVHYPGSIYLFKMKGKGNFVWGTSICWYYFQVLYGDPADEIEGCGLSQLECFKILQPVYSGNNAFSTDFHTNVQRIILKEYLRAHKTKQDMIKVANLVWLKRTRNKTEPFPFGETLSL